MIKNKIFDLILFLSLILTTMFLIGPIVVLIIQGANYVIPSLMSEEIIFSIKLSLKTSLLSTFICLVISIPASYAIYKNDSKWTKIIEHLIYVPMSLPHLVSGIALLLFFGNRGLGRFLSDNFGIDFVFTVSGVVLAQIFVNLSFSIQILLNSLREIDKKTIFVSRTLGCNEIQSFIHIVIPSLRTGILSSAIMCWSKALGEFGAVMMLAGTTRMKTEVIPTAIYLNMATGDLNLAIGTATILIVISLTCLGIFNMIFMKKGSN